MTVRLRTCFPLFLIFIFLFLIFMYLPLLPSPSSNKPLAQVWPVNATRDVRKLILPDKNTTLIQASCYNSKKKSTYLVVFVSSAPNNFAQRKGIRETWAKDAKNASFAKVLFLIGGSKNKKNLTEEANKYHDILQQDFVDTYANLTVKSLMMLKWFKSNCDKVPYLLKTDDDMYINLKQLFSFIQSNKKPNVLMGSLICGAIPIKDPHNKWFVPSYMYSAPKFPNYLSGTAYLMSRSTALVVYEGALDTPLFHLEDIFLTGILARKAGIRPKDHVGFSYVKKKPSKTCMYKLTISSHHVSLSEMKSIYKRISNPSLKCHATNKSKDLRPYDVNKCVWNKS